MGSFRLGSFMTKLWHSASLNSGDNKTLPLIVFWKRLNTSHLLSHQISSDYILISKRTRFLFSQCTQMSYYKRARQDEELTFGNGRYPKRSRREPNGYLRDYHSLSVSRLQSNRSSHCPYGGVMAAEPNLYHYSLSSELYSRHSGSTCANHRYSNSSATSQQKRRHHPLPLEEERRAKIPRRESNHSSRVCFCRVRWRIDTKN